MIAPPKVAAASALLVYAAIPELPPSIALAEMLRPQVGSWRSVADDSLPMLHASEDQLQAICSLTENWDGYGGLPIHPETAVYAKSALAIFRQFKVMPDITPNPNGTISFEWASHLGEAHVEMGRSRYVGIVRPRGLADIPLAGSTTNLTLVDLARIAATISAALFPLETPSITSSIYALANDRSIS